jgi:hypothetical protein
VRITAKEDQHSSGPSRRSRNGKRASPGIKRRRWGIYYTPDEVANLLARWCIRSKDDSLLEPSFGGCALLQAAVEVYRELGCTEPGEQMHGFDIDSEAFKSLVELGLPNQGRFKRGDFLVSEPVDLRVTSVLANPPYVQYHRVPKSRRGVLQSLRTEFEAAKLSGRASLWVYFVLHATRYLARGGRMAFLLPRTLETADYSKTLLAYLRSRFHHIQLIHIDERLFEKEGADEQVSILLADGFLTGQEESSFERLEAVDLEELKAVVMYRTNDGSRRTRGQRDQALSLLSSFSEATTPLGDCVTVKIGEVVGATKFFVRNLDAWKALGVARKHLKPLLTRSSQCSSMYLTTDAVAEGKVPFLLLPSQNVKDGTILELLQSWTVEKRQKNSTFRKRQHWFRCSYDTDFDAFIPSLNHAFARVIANTANISCGNGLYKLRVSTPGLAAWLPLVALSSPFRLAVEVYGRPRGGGALKLEPSDVRRLLIPRVDAWLPTEATAVAIQCEERLKVGDIAGATHLVDELLFVRTGLLHRHQVASARDLVEALVAKRFR